MNRNLLRLLAVASTTALVGLAAPACQGDDGAPAGEAPGEGVDQRSSAVKVANCTCPTKGNCAALSYSDKPANGIYYITSYGGGNETQPQSCPGMPLADGTWAYIADLARFGCGTKVKIEANGKSCVAQVADCGPNRCVEDAAADPVNCGSHFPIIDASPLITKHLFGSASAGWSDKFKVTVSTVSSSTPIGCPGGGSSGAGGASGGSGGKGGSGGSQPQNECNRDSDCGAGAKCDKSTTHYRCVTRKNLGEACSGDQECHGGLTGTQRICHQGQCTDACRQQFDCALPSQCQIAQGQQVGSCAGSGCQLDYPSVSILGIPTPQTVRSSYTSRGCSGVPSCVIDVNNIIDAKTGQKLSYKMVKLSENFSLREMTWQTAASSPYVYVDPDFIKHLQDTRTAYGSSIHVNSGFRSPIHQNNICRGMCGAASCPGTCARCSNHMDGRAADLTHSSPKCGIAKKACQPGQMHLIYNELAGGDHLHVDTGAQPVCSYQAISCP